MLEEKEIAALESRMREIIRDPTILSHDTKILAVIAICCLNQRHQSRCGEEARQDHVSESQSSGSLTD